LENTITAGSAGVLIEDEIRRIPEVEATTEVGSYEPGRLLQAGKGFRFAAGILLRVAHRGHIHARETQIAGECDIGDSHERKPRILGFPHEDIRNLGAYLIRDSRRACIGGFRHDAIYRWTYFPKTGRQCPAMASEQFNLGPDEFNGGDGSNGIEDLVEHLIDIRAVVRHARDAEHGFLPQIVVADLSD
jgi:hypothetical protein